MQLNKQGKGKKEERKEERQEIRQEKKKEKREEFETKCASMFDKGLKITLAKAELK
jgi:hypothetical protein